MRPIFLLLPIITLITGIKLFDLLPQLGRKDIKPQTHSYLTIALLALIVLLCYSLKPTP